ncbi:MAG TPA: extracellular solute-binding protein [Gaiellaceae bacterium]|jgi:ABC-type glycerol-3-phosphate transport system substrate-binding protein
MRKDRLIRLVLFALAALALAVAASACGGSSNESEGGGSGGASSTGGANENVSGKVSVMGIWTADEQKSFQAVIDGFEDKYPNVSVKYNPVGDNLPTVLSTAVQGGNPPDIADIAQPGLIQGFVDKGAAKPIDFMKDTVASNFGDSIVQVGTFNGKLYGLMFKAANKSTVWYNKAVYSDAGVEPTDDWDTFLKNADTIKASGVPAYSIGGADGWTLTDLFENIYIRTAGADLYDKLSKHEIKWTDQSVKEALTEMAKVIGDSDNIAGGTEGALQTDFPTSVSNVFAENPKAAMVLEGDFVPGVVETKLKAGTDYDVFDFPNINGSPKSVVGGGDIMTMFNDTPATRAFMEYLATPEAAQIWAERGGFSSPNKQLDPSVYPDPILRKTASAIGEAEVFRFDMSDLQPSAFGATVGQGEWKIFQDFLKNPQDIDGTASALESAAAKAFANQ